MNRRRNEKSVPPLQSCKAEMTSGVSSSSVVGSNQNKPSTNPQLPGLSGGRPTSSNSNNAVGLLRASVAAQPASRVEATNNVPLHRSPTTSTTVGSLHSSSTTSSHNNNNSNNKKVTRNNSKQPSRTSIDSISVLATPPALGPFHPSIRLVVDNPDLKLESQGSTVANYGPELGLRGPESTATGLADTDSSPLCDRDTNYVVFDYPDALIEQHHYSQVVVNEENQVDKTPPKRHRNNIMGTYPDVGYRSEKSPDDDSSADIAQQHLKEDDLLDDFFKFVSNGTCIL